MKHDIIDTESCLIQLQDSEKSPYMQPKLMLLELEGQDIASGGPNPGPDGTFGNLS
jgi:hypothetical protein